MSIASNFLSWHEKTKNKTVNPQYRPKVLSHELFLTTPGLRNHSSNHKQPSRKGNFTHVVSPSDLTGTFHPPREHPHNARVNFIRERTGYYLGD